MAHHGEPMDVDDMESDFDNKENTYHHSNVLPRTPCTEKGYEELNVSELNMKLRYSITPAASPMSKSMSHCLDSRYNTSTDESLNNTVVNENEHNLTRSLHSTLNKTDSKSPKVLPLQALPAELAVDSNRNSTILQPLAAMHNGNDILITVNNVGEIDNLSFPSSSSSLSHTPEATTPTKEPPKDGGSPIMRGLKSVLSMFRSSQSPIPPAEAENKAVDTIPHPTGVQLPDSKPQATASTPINQKNRERSLSKRNSPHKESLVFNEDLEKELQWNDDSTIIFSTEKVPIHKLFFQDKPASSKMDNLPPNEDVNSSVEYMDVSYNDLSIRERTLNATANKSTAIDIAESDGEFVDCETTFTQDEPQANTEEVHSEKFANKQQNYSERGLVESVAVNEIPMFNTTVDIIKLIDCSQIDINVSQAATQLDISTTDIVNRLSDLIDASETNESTLSLDKHEVCSTNTGSPMTNDVLKQTESIVQPKLLENLATSPENPSFPETSVEFAENVSTKNTKIENVIEDLPNSHSHSLESNIGPVLPVFSSMPVKVISMTPNESISATAINNDTEKVEGEEINPLPVDIPLPNEDDFNELADSLIQENVNAEMLTKTLLLDETGQNTILAALDKNTTKLTPEIKLKHIESENSESPCQINLLPSDIPLPNVNDNNFFLINTFPHEAVTVVPDPVRQTAITTDVDNMSKNDLMCSAETTSSDYADMQTTITEIKTCLVDETAQNTLSAVFDNTTTKLASVTKHEQIEDGKENNDGPCQLSLLPSDVPSPNMNDNHSFNINSFPLEAVTVVSDPIQLPTAGTTDADNILQNYPMYSAETTPGDYADMQLSKTAITEIKTLAVDAAQNTSFETPDKTTTNLTPDIEFERIEGENKTNESPCQLILLPSDVPLTNVNDNHSSNINTLPHEAVAVVPDPVRLQTAATTDVIAVVDNIVKNDSMCSVETTLGYNTDTELVKSIIPEISNPTDTIKPNEEDKMDVSYCDELTESLSKTLPIDATVITASSVELKENIKMGDSSKLEENLPIGNQTLYFEPELTEVTNHKIETVAEKHALITEKQIEKEEAKPVISTDINVIEDKSEIAPIVANFKTYENAALSNQNTFDVTTSLVSEISIDQNTDSKVSEVRKDISNKIDNATVTKISEPLEIVIPSLPATSEVDNSKEANTDSSIKEDIKITQLPKDLSIVVNSDPTEIGPEPMQAEETIDEEIVVSESNSPFVSLSAEEEFDIKTKTQDFDEIAKPLRNKSPPLSPKIVSKGYNLNFDDIDSINPFATKTKIRMSPPPGVSPNASLESVNKSKTEKAELPNKANNDNRRKSMPERKKPLKAKRNFNSTFDSTKSAASKQVDHKTYKDKDDIKTTADNKQINDEVQTDIISPVSQEVTLGTVNLDETYQVQEKVVPNVHDSNNTTVQELGRITDNSTKMIEDVMSESCKSPEKPDNTSSSEQSTYFSAASSSSECTGSRNVFNLPEIDDKDFNPFATKSKIRQSPPPDLDVVNPFATKSKIKSSPETSFVIPQNNIDATVLVENQNEFKETTCNLSNCSGSSRTSDEKDVTVQEVHTEDEDTIEGPFLEADDDNGGDKIPELTNDRIDIDFNNLNAQANENDTDAAEMFIDAEAFEFLMNQNNTDEVAYSGKESLFLKFDPLFAQRVTSEGVAAALSEIKKRQSTPKKMPKPALPKNEELMSFEKSVAGPSDLNNTRSVKNESEEVHDDINVTILSKPMMAVTPAINPVVTPKKSLTPNRTNRLSTTFTSPAMAVIDRLLSLSGNSPSTGLDATVTHASRERTEADLALTQLRELLAEKEINVYNLRCESKELKSRLSNLETQMKSLEAVSEERLKKVNELTENLAEKTKMNRSMAAVVEEYERTIASLISETEQDKKRYMEERNQLIRDRDEQTAHLTSMEVSFSDLHSKYEKSKQVIMGYKTNEDAYKNSIKEFEDNLAKMHTNYELLKQHATSKLNHANQELEKLNKAHEAEILKFNAMIKRKDLHITSLEESLAQKTKANEELTAICDELINKVG